MVKLEERRKLSLKHSRRRKSMYFLFLSLSLYLSEFFFFNLLFAGKCRRVARGLSGYIKILIL